MCDCLPNSICSSTTLANPTQEGVYLIPEQTWVSLSPTVLLQCGKDIEKDIKYPLSLGMHWNRLIFFPTRCICMSCHVKGLVRLLRLKSQTSDFMISKKKLSFYLVFYSSCFGIAAGFYFLPLDATEYSTNFCTCDSFKVMK